MSTDTLESRIARLATPPARLKQLTGGQLLALALLTHGVADVVITAAFWQFESNPAVLELGLGPWVVLKLALLASLIGAAAIARGHRYSKPILGVAAATGTVATVSNLVAIAVFAMSTGGGLS